MEAGRASLLVCDLHVSFQVQQALYPEPSDLSIENHTFAKVRISGSCWSRISVSKTYNRSAVSTGG